MYGELRIIFVSENFSDNSVNVLLEFLNGFPTFSGRRSLELLPLTNINLHILYDINILKIF